MTDERDEILLGGPTPEFDASAALERFRVRAARERAALRPAWMRSALAAAAFVLVIAAAGMTGVADTIIKIFEPQHVATVQVDPSQLGGVPDPSEYGTLTWITPPSHHEVADAAAAAAEAGFAPLSPSTLPKGVSAQVRFAVMPEAKATFRFEEDKARAAAAKVNATLPPMPASIAQTTLTMSGGPAILQEYGDVAPGATGSASFPQILIVQAKAPVVTSDGASVEELRDYALIQPGIPPSVASQVSAIGDPVRTLLVPVGIDMGSAKPVTVRGTQGYLFSDGTGIGTALVWVERGQVIGILASLEDAEIVSLANSLR